MKKILLAVATSAAVLAAVPAHAASPQTGTFIVTAPLTPDCTIVTTGALTFPSYTAFAAAPVTATGPVVVLTCTRGLMAAGGTTAVLTGTGVFTGGPVSKTPAALAQVGSGVVNGLQYLVSNVTTATAGIAPDAATLTTITSGDATTFTFSGSIPAGQAGAVAPISTETVTLTVTY